MKQCYGYIRVSTVKQGEGVSLEAQKDAIEAFATRNDIFISKWFEEKQTAAKRGRLLFNQMISGLKKGSAAGVVFHKIDRSARNFSDWAKIGDLSDAGVDVHFSTESLDFRSRGGRLTADIQAVIAADYIRNLRDETIKGIQGRLKQGLYPFRAPIGYLDNGGGKPKTIDPVRGPLIRQLFELYATGNYSYWTLRIKAKSLGLRNIGRGQPLSKTGIETILRNPFYMGVIKIKRSGKVFSGIHEPLLSSFLFDQATAVRTGRGNKITTKHQHRYRGLFQCGYCSLAMIPELQKGRVYYRCHTKGCLTKTLREDQLEKEVQRFLSHYSLSDKRLEELRKEFGRRMDERCDVSNGKQAEMELAKLDNRLSRLEDKLLDGVLDDETYKRKKEDIIFDRHRLIKVTRKNAKKAELVGRLGDFLELMKNLYSAYVVAAAEQKREIVRFATSNRRIFERKVDLQPSEWMQAFKNVPNLDRCPPCRSTSRTFELMEKMLEQTNEQEIEQLLEYVTAVQRKH